MEWSAVGDEHASAVPDVVHAHDGDDFAELFAPSPMNRIAHGMPKKYLQGTGKGKRTHEKCEDAMLWKSRKCITHPSRKLP